MILERSISQGRSVEASTAEPEYYNISQAAELLGVSRVTVSRWIRAGRLPVARLGHRTTRIRRADLERLLSDHGLQPAPAQLSQPARNDGMTGLGRSTPEHPEHIVQFYEDDAAILESVSEYIGTGLDTGAVGIAIVSEAHRRGIEERLRARGTDLESARKGGQFIALDAAEMLERFVVNGEPDPERFAEVVGTVIMRAAEGGRAVRAFGEMVALLAADGNYAASVRLESLWNGLQRVLPFSLYCGYPMEVLRGSAYATVLGDICGEHDHVVPLESFTRLNDPDARLREIARLQHDAASLEVEVAARRLAEERLRLREQELRDFVENATEGLHWVDADGRILWANKAELELLGYAAEEYIGRPIAEVHADPDVIADILQRLGAGEELRNYEARLVARDGSLRDVLINSNVYREDGRFVHTRCFTRDVSDRKLAEIERERLLECEREARAEAEAALRLRDEFLSVAAHELRTPIAVLKGFAELTERRLNQTGQLDPERAAEALRAISGQSDKLDRLLSRLLDISRLQGGKLTLERQPTDVVALVEQIVSAARARDERHDISLLAPPLLEVNVDPLRLEQVITNLLDNAIKYSPDGRSIEITVCRSSDRSLEIAVLDHGLGIPAERRERIFERYYQAHGEGYRSGLGLGLYVSGQIVELHGGEIRAEFPHGGGTRFVVRLPSA